MTPQTLRFARDATQQFTATGTYSDGGTLNLTSSVTWSSTNTAVATISGTGRYGVRGGSGALRRIQATSRIDQRFYCTDSLFRVIIGFGRVVEVRRQEVAPRRRTPSRGTLATPCSLVNGVSWIVGKIGGAISANGTNQYGTVPAINLNAFASTVTVAFWANRTYSTAMTESVMLEVTTNYNNFPLADSVFFPDDTECQGIAGSWCTVTWGTA